MGCVSSKQGRSTSPDFALSVPPPPRVRGKGKGRRNGSSVKSDALKRHHHRGGGFGELEKINEESENENEESEGVNNHDLGNSKPSSTKVTTNNSEKKSSFSFKFGRITEAENVAAGWPPWLSAVAGEAIAGWLPLRSDLFEKFDKIGQGTYSSVYRARNVETGKIVALKKVRFDTFQPESVRFMAREINILRRLDHPNIMKLEGLVTSRLSCNIYLVFEYMEHDLSGLLSCPEIKFSDSQIKCYMRQLLSGLDHCHSRGIIHRDIKSSNILVNNKGILKIADFGLANFLSARHNQPLTSRVVTLWYRPPELLMGSTNYGATVDLWSVGCVFAELFIGKPILKGRTEVEQLHKIFKLCGSPADEYWNRSKLPLASMFKPQHPYESTLRERCKEFPKSAVNLIETFLSIEPYKRGIASSALNSEYFTTKPYACDPTSLPKYPPNKELDAKYREEVRRRKAGIRTKASGSSRNQRRTHKSSQENSSSRVVPTEDIVGRSQYSHRSTNAYNLRGKGATECRDTMTSSYDTVSEASQYTEVSQDASIRSVPVLPTTSSGFDWSQRRKPDAMSVLSFGPANRGSQNASALDSSHAALYSYEIAKRAMERKQVQPNRPEPSGSSDVWARLALSTDLSDQQQRGRGQYSGPLVSHSNKVEQRQGYDERAQSTGPLLSHSSTRSFGRASFGSQDMSSLDMSDILEEKEETFDSEEQENEQSTSRFRSDSYESVKRAMQSKQGQFDGQKSTDSYDMHAPRELSTDYRDQRKRPQFSSSTLSQSQRNGHGQESRERGPSLSQTANRRQRGYINQAVGRSRFN